MHKPKLLLISNYPTTYRVDFYNALVDKFGIDQIHFIFVQDKQVQRKDISVYAGEQFLNCAKIIEYTPHISVSGNIFSIVNSFKPNALILGGFPYYTATVCIAAFINKTKLINWWGGTMMSEQNSSIYRKLYRMSLSRFFSAGIFYSPLAEAHFKTLHPGLRHSVVLGNNTRDSRKIFNTYLNAANQSSLSREAKTVSFVTVGFQSPRKNTIKLLEAVKLLKDDGIGNISVSVIGDGTELHALRDYAKKHTLPVDFLGFQEPNEVLRTMVKHDVFIHPSKRDLWPQTYTEAICLGMPVLISDRSGVDDEYTRKFADKIYFDPLNPTEIAMKMKLLIASPSLRKTLANESLNNAIGNDGISGAEKVWHLIEQLA